LAAGSGAGVVGDAGGAVCDAAGVAGAAVSVGGGLAVAVALAQAARQMPTARLSAAWRRRMARSAAGYPFTPA
jgi:hypothetical protein